MITAATRNKWEESIRSCCRALFLTAAIPELISRHGTPKQIEYLAIALQKEMERREETKRERLVKRARFPTYKTFEDYEYRCVKLPPALSREELEAARFIEEKNNLVLYGPVGIGKTHMAIAAGVSACMKGYKVRFYTVTELVLNLAEARKNGTLERLRSELNSLDLLILDEWGYVPVDRDGSQLLFRVISDSYESKSLLLTTNLEFSKWGGIFTDDQMAAAMIDRLVHHGHLILFEGNSYRMEHALMKQTARQPGAGASRQRTFRWTQIVQAVLDISATDHPIRRPPRRGAGQGRVRKKPSTMSLSDNGEFPVRK